MSHSLLHEGCRCTWRREVFLLPQWGDSPTQPCVSCNWSNTPDLGSRRLCRRVSCRSHPPCGRSSWCICCEVDDQPVELRTPPEATWTDQCLLVDHAEPASRRCTVQEVWSPSSDLQQIEPPLCISRSQPPRMETTPSASPEINHKFWISLSE